MMQPLEALLGVAATQAAAGQVTPRILEEATRAVEKLHRWLRARQADLAEGTYRDGNAFLRKLDQALKTMGS
jgi:hypothetical protein